MMENQFANQFANLEFGKSTESNIYPALLVWILPLSKLISEKQDTSLFKAFQLTNKKQMIDLEYYHFENSGHWRI